MALGYGLDDKRFDSRQGLGMFLFTTASRPDLRPTQPPIQLLAGTLSLKVKRPGREADHSPPSSAEVNNAWTYTFPAPAYFHCVMRSLKKSTGTILPLSYCYSVTPICINF
jgi:hypothetical protein